MQRGCMICNDWCTQHKPEVFPLDVVELRAEERPVEAELDHVVPPDAAVEVVVRVVVPAVPAGGGAIYKLVG